MRLATGCSKDEVITLTNEAEDTGMWTELDYT